MLGNFLLSWHAWISEWPLHFRFLFSFAVDVVTVLNVLVGLLADWHDRIINFLCLVVPPLNYGVVVDWMRTYGTHDAAYSGR